MGGGTCLTGRAVRYYSKMFEGLFQISLRILSNMNILVGIFKKGGGGK